MGVHTHTMAVGAACRFESAGGGGGGSKKKYNIVRDIHQLRYSNISSNKTLSTSQVGLRRCICMLDAHTDTLLLVTCVPQPQYVHCRGSDATFCLHLPCAALCVHTHTGAATPDCVLQHG